VIDDIVVSILPQDVEGCLVEIQLVIRVVANIFILWHALFNIYLIHIQVPFLLDGGIDVDNEDVDPHDDRNDVKERALGISVHGHHYVLDVFLKVSGISANGELDGKSVERSFLEIFEEVGCDESYHLDHCIVKAAIHQKHPLDQLKQILIIGVLLNFIDQLSEAFCEEALGLRVDIPINPLLTIDPSPKVF